MSASVRIRRILAVLMVVGSLFISNNKEPTCSDQDDFIRTERGWLLCESSSVVRVIYAREGTEKQYCKTESGSYTVQTPLQVKYKNLTGTRMQYVETKTRKEACLWSYLDTH